jgi:hypothetical protein
MNFAKLDYRKYIYSSDKTTTDMLELGPFVSAPNLDKEWNMSKSAVTAIKVVISIITIIVFVTVLWYSPKQDNASLHTILPNVTESSDV